DRAPGDIVEFAAVRRPARARKGEATARRGSGKVPRSIGRRTRPAAVPKDRDRPANAHGGVLRMDAHRAWSSPRLAAALVLSLASLPCGAATYRTTNFEVQAPTQEAARQVGDHAEECRRTIARAWLGRELPDWTRPC